MEDDRNAFERFLQDRLKIPQGLEHLALTFGLVAIAGIAFGAYKIGEQLRVAKGGFSDTDQRVLGWESVAPYAIDVDGDGTADMVGMFAGEPSGIHLGAFRPQDGKLIWRAGPFDVPRTPTGLQSPFAVQGDRIAVTVKGGKVHVLQVKDGKEVGTVQIPNGRGLLCASEEPSGPLGAPTTFADKPYALDLSTLEVTLLDHRIECALPSAQAVTVDLEGLDLPEREAIKKMAQAGDTLYVARTKDAKWFVAAHSAKTAAERWRVPLEGQVTDTVTGLTATTSHLFVVQGGALVVLDATNGKLIGVLGGEA